MKMFLYTKYWQFLLFPLLLTKVIISLATQQVNENLLAQIFEKHFQLSNFALEQSAHIVRETLQDSFLSNEELRKSLQDYVRDVEQVQQQTALPSNNVANRFLQLVSKTVVYQEFEKIETDADAAFALRRHRLMEFKAQLEERRIEFLKRFLQLVAEFIRTNDRDGDTDGASERLRNWYARYEGVRDTKRIDEMLSEFVTLV